MIPERFRCVLAGLTLLSLALAVAAPKPSHASGDRNGAARVGFGVAGIRFGGLLTELLFPCRADCAATAHDCATAAESEAVTCAEDTCDTAIKTARNACATDLRAGACQDARSGLIDCIAPCRDTQQADVAACGSTLQNCVTTCGTSTAQCRPHDDPTGAAGGLRSQFEAAKSRRVDDSDESLMVRAGHGDRAACQLLVERHLTRIVAFARRTLGRGDYDTEDVAQDVFLRVWAAAPRWSAGRARFTTWLYRVAMNVCLDRIAKKRETTMEAFPDVPDPRPDPSRDAEDAQLAGHVRQALAALPETQRVAVVLCHYQGLGNIEAADVLGVSVEALESLLARGRRSMRDRLRPLAPVLARHG